MSGGGRAKQEEARQRASLTDDAVLSPPFVRAVILSLGPPALVDGEAIMWCPHFFCSLLLCASFTALILLTLSSPSCCLPLPFRLIPASPPSLPGAVAALEVLLLRLLSSPHRFFFLARPLPPVAPFPSPGPRRGRPPSPSPLSLPPDTHPPSAPSRLSPLDLPVHYARSFVFPTNSASVVFSPSAFSFAVLLLCVVRMGQHHSLRSFSFLGCFTPVTMPATSVRGIRGPCPHTLCGEAESPQPGLGYGGGLLVSAGRRALAVCRRDLRSRRCLFGIAANRVGDSANMCVRLPPLCVGFVAVMSSVILVLGCAVCSGVAVG